MYFEDDLFLLLKTFFFSSLFHLYMIYTLVVNICVSFC